MTTKTKTINGLAFEIAQPYEAGHALTEAEAKALNQTRSENIGNNLRGKIKELQDANASFEDISALVADADSRYEFTLAAVSASRKLDPYEREARSIARELLKNHLAASGRKLTTVPADMSEDEWKEKVETTIDEIASRDQVVKAAKKAVDAKRKQAESLVESLGEMSV